MKLRDENHIMKQSDWKLKARNCVINGVPTAAVDEAVLKLADLFIVNEQRLNLPPAAVPWRYCKTGEQPAVQMLTEVLERYPER